MFDKLLWAKMRIVFRTDASLEIGTGHVMRCLTLADALQERGAKCSFMCRPHLGHLLDLVAQRGHQALALPYLQDGEMPNYDGSAHTGWLGTSWSADAADSLQVLHGNMGGESLDWLVVDHYALDQRWEKALRANTRRMMVIDDLADRPHDCDLLLDQNLGRTGQDYVDLLHSATAILIGPQYAILRPEFAKLRHQSLARRAQNPQLKHLLISMGGVDKGNATGQVLSALKDCKLPSDLRITVVMGPHAPWLEQVKIQAAYLQWPTEVLIGVNNLAKLMAHSDLAIGAAGGTAWERCCLGLPSLVLVQAENQQACADALQNAGATITLSAPSQISDVCRKLRLIESTCEPLIKLIQAAAVVTEGDGCVRIIQRMLKCDE